MKRFLPLLLALLWTLPASAQLYPPGGPPAFDTAVPLPFPEAQVCTPLFMVMPEQMPPPGGGEFPAPAPGMHTWWVRATGGPMDIDLIAHSVNVVEEEGFAEMFLFSPTNALIGHIVVHHPFVENGAEDVGTVSVIDAPAGGLYRVEVWVGTYPMYPKRPARHYRLRTRGADLIGINTPLPRLAEAHPSKWILSAQAGFPVAGLFTLGFNEGEVGGFGEVALFDETGAPRGVFNTETGHLPFDGGIADIAGPWTLDVRGMSEHYVFNVVPLLNGAYVSWKTAGHGGVSGSITRGGEVNADPVMVMLRDPVTGWRQMEQVTSEFAFHGLRPGAYRMIVRFSPDPNDVLRYGVTITCDSVAIHNVDIPAEDGDADGDGVVDSIDQCPATVWPESVPERRLNTNHWALVDNDRVFDTVIKGKGGGTGRSYTLDDTAGCSCEQIIDALDLGDGHRKFGCSNSAMDDWVALISGAGKIAPVVQEVILPDGVELDGNYPNPFNPVTAITFRLEEAADVTLTVYDALGREVEVLIRGFLSGGNHTVRFDAVDLPSGLYVYRLHTPQGLWIRSMTLVK